MLYYENQFPSREPTLLHYQVLRCLGGFAFLARSALIPEAEPNLWCLSQVPLTPASPYLLLYLPPCICGTA